MKPYITTCLLLMAFPKIARAEQSFNVQSSLLQVTWALLIVLGIIFAIYGLITKRLLPNGPRAGSIQILETKQILHKNILILVHIEGRKLLLAGGQNGINLLADLGGENQVNKDDSGKIAKELLNKNEQELSGTDLNHKPTFASFLKATK
ncbi:MAG: flagellar biosynthetic protein FliO [Desulfobulbaceae bacterium]|nr:flagellar biosynthetic protein FliO [Desulfobulbaceae bacterium]